jgi:hypothetical protein
MGTTSLVAEKINLPSVLKGMGFSPYIELCNLNTGFTGCGKSPISVWNWVVEDAFGIFWFVRQSC